MKKLIALVTAAACIPISASYAAKPNMGERVNIIVKVKGGAVLDNEEAARTGIKLFSNTEEAKETEDEIREAQEKVKSEIERTTNGSTDIGYSYTYTFNGFSLDAYESDIEKIKAVPDVEEVYISQEYTSPEELPADAYIESGGQMMNIGYLRELGISGQGQVIAVIDDGFDIAHEYYSGAVEGARLSKSDIENVIENNDMSAVDINGREVTVNKVYRSEKIPYAFDYYTRTSDTFDSANTHGTHVAGIAAGNNGTDPDGKRFEGAAPDAQLLLMACTKLYSSALIAAIEDSVKLGADVINASWGTTYTETDNATKTAIETAVKAGIIFCASADNSSRGYNNQPIRPENIDYSAGGVPNGFTAATSVASAESGRVWSFYRLMYLGDGTELHFNEENESVSFGEKFSSETEYVYCGNGGAEDFKDKNVKDKIALMERKGDLTFADRVKNAKSAGAVGAVFINDTDSLPISINQASVSNMPCAGVAKKDAESLINAPVKTIRAQTEDYHEFGDNPETGMSRFSSWGVNSSLELKPEITAPGGQIYSSVSNDEYDNKSGTSMASPYMAGAAALMKQYFIKNADKYGFEKDESLNGFIENMLMSAAKVMYQNPEEHIPYSPRLQGAGRADLKAAAQSPVTLIGDVYGDIEKSKISLREIGDSFEIKFKAKNHTDKPVTYDKLTLTVITDDVDEEGYVGDMKKLGFSAKSPESVTIDGSDSQEITINVTLDKTELEANKKIFSNGFFADGFVSLSASDNSVPEVSIPFTGFYGDWTKAKALDNTIFEFDAEPVIEGGTYPSTNTKRTVSGGTLNIEARHILGTNFYADKNAEDYKDYVSEDYVGISPNNDGECDKFEVVITPLRRLGKTTIELLDKNNKILAERIDTNSDGSIYYTEKFNPTYLHFDQSTIDFLDDGDYKMHITTGFAAAEEALEDAEFNFYVDRQKPQISAFETYEKEGRTYLKVAASDNRHLMSISVSGRKRGSRFFEVHPIKALTSIEESFDITGADLSSLTAEIMDYAFNSEKRSFAGLEIKYSKYVRGSGTITHLFNVNNTKGEDIGAALILALYRNGRLVGTSINDTTITQGETLKTFSSRDVLYDSMKVFVWDSVTGMEPMYEAFKIK